MRAERQLLRVGEYLVGRACRRLPPGIREERYREWAAELPAVLHDSQIRPALQRAIRMLAYAADTLRGATLEPARARRSAARMGDAHPMKGRRMMRARGNVPSPEVMVAIFGSALFVAVYPFVPAVHQFLVGPSLSEMILGLVLFLIVFAAVGTMVSRALNVIAVRSCALEEDLTNAKEVHGEARRMHEESRTTITGAEVEAARMRQEARERGAWIMTEAREHARTHARLLVEDATSEIRGSCANAVAGLEPQIAELAAALSERILGEPPSERSSPEPRG
jgi:F-type H+-transporting ATPase subunit b